MFCTWIFWHSTFSLTEVFISSTWSSMPEVLSSMSYSLLVRPASEVFVWHSKIFTSCFVSVSIFFSDFVSTFMPWTVFIIPFNSLLLCVLMIFVKGFIHILLRSLNTFVTAILKFLSCAATDLHFSQPTPVELWGSGAGNCLGCSSLCFCTGV